MNFQRAQTLSTDMVKWMLVETDKKTSEIVGQEDHFVQPIVAAALFGLTAVLKDGYGIKISFGDMSSSNGSDPWQPGEKHHYGHGHKGNRSGLDVDFRYVNKDGVSFQSQTAQLIHNSAKKKIKSFTILLKSLDSLLIIKELKEYSKELQKRQDTMITAILALIKETQR